MTDVEELDSNNILEIEEIRVFLSEGEKVGEHKRWSPIFEMLVRVCNDKLNKKEYPIQSMPLEDNTEPSLSDHSSDEDNLVDED